MTRSNDASASRPSALSSSDGRGAEQRARRLGVAVHVEHPVGVAAAIAAGLGAQRAGDEARRSRRSDPDRPGVRTRARLRHRRRSSSALVSSSFSVCGSCQSRRGRVAVEAAARRVPQPAVRHRVERALDDRPPPLVAGLAEERHREVQRRGVRELRLDPEPAVLLVERGEDQTRLSLRYRRPAPPVRLAVGFGEPTRFAVAAAVDRERRDTGSASATRVSTAVIRSAATNVPPAMSVPLRRQERRGRPAAQVVALVDVGTAIGVDADGDEAIARRAPRPRGRRRWCDPSRGRPGTTPR